MKRNSPIIKAANVVAVDKPTYQHDLTLANRTIQQQAEEIARLRAENAQLRAEMDITDTANTGLYGAWEQQNIELAKFKDAEAQGRLVMLPFAIGQKVYCLHTEGVLKGKAIEQIVHGYSESKWQGRLNAGKDYRFVICHNSYNQPIAWELRYVYATPEAAEAAQRESTNDN